MVDPTIESMQCRSELQFMLWSKIVVCLRPVGFTLHIFGLFRIIYSAEIKYKNYSDDHTKAAACNHVILSFAWYMIELKMV